MERKFKMMLMGLGFKMHFEMTLKWRKAFKMHSRALGFSNPLCKKISLVGFGSGPRKVAMQRWVDGYLENGYVV